MTAIANRTQSTVLGARTPASGKAAHRKKGVLHYIGVGLSFGLLALVMLIAVLVIALPMLTKSTPYTVLTGSMTPSYPAGTLVIVKPTDVQQIRIGDVVTYQIASNQPAVVTHRVIQIVEPTTADSTVSFITKGDANSLPDAKPVQSVQVRGVVWYAVPYIGWVNNIVNGDARSVVIPIVAGGLFLYAGFMVASTVVDRRRKARAAAQAEALQDRERSRGRDEMDDAFRDLFVAGRR
ncbi:MAG TPA: signal peptidase I [Pseudolysinimonas sp.]|nr:signal peptidase I [Pseudolysinimonas sp.]